MEEKKNYQNLTLPALILGLSLLLSFLIFASRIYIKQESGNLSVIGSTKQKVVSDIVKWRSEFIVQVLASELSSGYKKMNNDEKLITDFLYENGVSKDELRISPILMEQVYKPEGGPREYLLRQTVEINSNNVQKITELAKNVQRIVDRGVIFSTLSLEYYYSKLPELRISLLSPAIEDAKKRAEQIARASGKKIDTIRSASMGVVQVLSPNSIEISDYGTYDTSSIEKEVMVTVRVVFGLK